MLVGFLGDIPFIASRSKVRTFDDFQKQSDGRWQDHDIIGQKPASEFIGPGKEQITFKMLLRSDLGVNPAKEVKKLERMRDKGEVVPLVIGNRVIGDNYWVVKGIAENVTFWSKSGHPISISLSVTLSEYKDQQPLTLGQAYHEALS